MAEGIYEHICKQERHVYHSVVVTATCPICDQRSLMLQLQAARRALMVLLAVHDEGLKLRKDERALVEAALKGGD